MKILHKEISTLVKLTYYLCRIINSTKNIIDIESFQDKKTNTTISSLRAPLFYSIIYYQLHRLPCPPPHVFVRDGSGATTNRNLIVS